MSEPPKRSLQTSDDHVTRFDQVTNQPHAALEVVDPSRWPLTPPPYSPTAPSSDFYSTPGTSNLHHDQQPWTQPPFSHPLLQQHGKDKQSAVVVDPSVLEGLLSNGQNCPQVVDQPQVINVIQMMPEQHAPAKRNSYIAHMLFSCSVFLCCGISGWVCGLIGFILALCASSKSSSGKIKQAKSIGRASIIFSVIGAVIGGILVIIIVASRK